MHCEISTLWPGKKKYQEHFRGYENMPHCPKGQMKKYKILKEFLLPSNSSESHEALLLFGGTVKALMGEPELASKPWTTAWTLFVLPTFVSCLPWLVFLFSTISAHRSQICIICFDYCISFFLDNQSFLRIHLCNLWVKGKSITLFWNILHTERVFWLFMPNLLI